MIRLIGAIINIAVGWMKAAVFYSVACFFRQALIKKGKHTRIYYNVFVKFPENIEIADNTFINYGVCLWAAPKGKILIGSDVVFGPNVTVIASNHGISRDNLIRLNEGLDGNIKIEDDVWIGANCVILKGVTIGKGAVIAAGTVVNKDIPEYTVYGGVSARFIKNRL